MLPPRPVSLGALRKFSGSLYHSGDGCFSGPYIYDKTGNSQGIGSNFQHKKYGLILAEAIGGKWVRVRVRVSQWP